MRAVTLNHVAEIYIHEAHAMTGWTQSKITNVIEIDITDVVVVTCDHDGGAAVHDMVNRAAHDDARVAGAVGNIIRVNHEPESRVVKDVVPKFEVRTVTVDDDESACSRATTDRTVHRKTDDPNI